MDGGQRDKNAHLGVVRQHPPAWHPHEPESGTCTAGARDWVSREQPQCSRGSKSMGSVAHCGGRGGPQVGCVSVRQVRNRGALRPVLAMASSRHPRHKRGVAQARHTCGLDLVRHSRALQLVRHARVLVSGLQWGTSRFGRQTPHPPRARAAAAGVGRVRVPMGVSVRVNGHRTWREALGSSTLRPSTCSCGSRR